jgi:breakpoint cluster region protein
MFKFLDPNLALSELRQKSPHLSANVLKLYLRELPEPLFTTHMYHRFMLALDCTVPEFRSVELCRIFNELPDVNKTIILFILTHLLKYEINFKLNKIK